VREWQMVLRGSVTVSRGIHDTPCNSDCVRAPVTVAVFRIHAGAGADRIIGDDGDNQLYGDDGNDELIGGLGDDRLAGGKGDDIVIGGNGDDQLFADDGFDQLTGGEGADHFHIQNSQNALIKDFASSDGDKIILDQISNINFSLAKSGKQLKRRLNSGSSNVIYYRKKNYALFREDDQEFFQRITFDKSAPAASVLQQNVFGWQDPMAASPMTTQSSDSQLNIIA
jgi:Ca2+-binding RTX toxin-like protein